MADSLEDIFVGKDRSLLTLLNGRLPVWYSLAHTSPLFVTKHSCSPQCQQNGLSWAKTLGDASRNGFKVVYSPIDMMDTTTPSLSYYIALLHKKLVGNEVFETLTLAGSRLSSHFYSYCTRNVSGGITVMGINEDDSRLKVFAKMPNAFTGTEVHQYVLSVDSQSGTIQVNGECVQKNVELKPIVRSKRPTKAINFILPPLSIGFWVFPHANLRECVRFNDGIENDAHLAATKRSTKTSKEMLLQQLILESIGKEKTTDLKSGSGRSKRHAVLKKDSNSVERDRRDVTNGIPIDDALMDPIQVNEENADGSIYKRNRRFIMDTTRPRRNLVDILYKEVDDAKRKQIFAPYQLRGSLGKHSRAKRQLAPGFAKLFQKFESMKPKKFGFKPVSSFKAKDAMAIPPIATVHDIYTPQSAELKVFRSSENRDLPTGDVYLELGGDDQQSPDYVSLDENNPGGQKIRKQQQSSPQMEIENGHNGGPLTYYDHMTGEFMRQQAMRPKAPPASPSRGRGELMEADVFHQNVGAGQETGDQPEEQPLAPQSQMEFIVPELEPTWQKNRQHLMAARNNLQEYYVNEQGQPILMTYQSPNAAYDPDEYDSNEMQFFRSNRRRRRSVDQTMNDKIEEKLKLLAEEHVATEGAADDNVHDYITDAVDKMGVLDKMLQIVDQLDQAKGDDTDDKYQKLSAEIKDLESFIYRKIPQFEKQFPIRKNRLNPTDIRRKCKVLATALEQKCLRDEEQFEKNLFKREVKYATESKVMKNKPLQKIVKKLFPKTAAAIAEKKKSLREKRDISLKIKPFSEDEFISNHISDEWDGNIPLIKPVVVPYDAEWESTDGTKLETKPQKQTQTIKTSDVNSALERIRTEHIPKIMHQVTGVAGRVFGEIHKQVAGWWKLFAH